MVFARIMGVVGRVISILVSLMFLVGGLIFFFCYDPAAYDSQGTGTVADIVESFDTAGDMDDTHYDVYIDYTVDGKKYEHVEYFEYHTGMKVGDKVEFFYMSRDPSQIAGSSKNAGPYIGLAFAVVGLVMLVVTVVRMIRGR